MLHMAFGLEIHYGGDLNLKAHTNGYQHRLKIEIQEHTQVNGSCGLVLFITQCLIHT